jgi:DNA adenine methylase
MGKSEIVVPFLKWAGGKRWLVSSYPELLNRSYKRYIEPFLGSGAVYFHLAPERSILADRNEELIETYQALRDAWHSVERELAKHHRNHSKNYYYAIRDSKPRTAHTRAARFIYLNRTCWNGLYRVNLNGKFNVPVGTKTNVVLESDNFRTVSNLLKTADLRAGDFEPIINEAGQDDLLFVDPPYTVKHNLNGFVKYNETLFSWEDQIRLRDCIRLATTRGASVVLTNAYHQSVRKLYKGIGQHRRLKRASVLAADSEKRKLCDELLVIVE